MFWIIKTDRILSLEALSLANPPLKVEFVYKLMDNEASKEINYNNLLQR